MRGAVLALVIAALAAAPAAAQPLGELPADDPSFGPILLIERIEVTGNRTTAERVIRHALPIGEGDQLRAGDPRLRAARYKLLALGFFREVELALRRGSARGRVILTVRVVERGTVVLNLLQFGTSRTTPWWVGADATERNLFGTGLGLGAGFLYAGAGEVDGASSQWAGELRLADASVAGSRFGAHGGLLYKDAFEPYRVAGRPDDEGVAFFDGFDYRRAGAVAGLGWDATPLSRLSADLRFESVRADLPDDPTRTTPDGQVVPVDLDLEDGDSRIVTVAAGYDRDTRADPVLPYGGDRLVVVGEVGHGAIGSSYDYARLLASYDHWWPVRGRTHVVAVKLLGGLILGDAPRFDLLHAADVNRMMTPRAFGLLLSAESATDFFGNDADEASYGELGGAAAVEYSYRLFRRRRHIYGGNLFVGAGLWTVARRDQLRDRGIADAVPLGLMVDAGLRLDTEIGIFELTIANALGRVQF